MAVDNTAIGSALIIPDSLLKNLGEVDKKIEDIQNTSKQTAQVFNTQFASMSLNTGNLLNNLQQVINQLGNIGQAAATASSATQNMGSGLGSATQQTAGLNTSITAVIEAINRLAGAMQRTGNASNGAMQGAANATKNMALEAAKAAKEQSKVNLLNEQTATNTEKVNLEIAKQAKLQAQAATEAAKLARAQAQLAQAQAMAATATERANAANERAAKRATINQYSQSASSALGYANDAANISTFNQRATAMKVLEAAMKNLNREDANYSKNLKELSARYKQLKADQDKLVESYQEIHRHHRRLMDTSGQLQRAFAAIFSVSQIKGYIENIAETRGYFELQHKSLQSILQDGTKATEIYKKTINLALDSPFRAKELITFTKQLAAYRIENDKLYDTTKRLADVSAGLGVSMDRLALAYGQVKAAAYLRGSEVRQFTEAGVNMYGELQSYFKEVKGEAYTTAQIVDMISKRKVTFEDVERIFKRMTDQGGLFYNMQHIQVETLSGKIGKFKDAVDQMMNSIGKSNEVLYKGGLDAVTYLVQNYEQLAVAVKSLVGAFIGMKGFPIIAKGVSTGWAAIRTNIVATSLSFNVASASSTKFMATLRTMGTLGVASVKALSTALWSLRGVIGGIAFMFAIDALMTVWQKTKELEKATADANSEFAKQKAKVSDLTYEFERLGKVKATALSQRNDKDYNASVDSMKKKLQELVDYGNKLGMNIKINVQGLKPDDLKAQFDNVKKQIDDYAQYLNTVKIRVAESDSSFFSDGITKSAENYDKAANSFIANSYKIDDAINIAKQHYGEATEQTQKYFDALHKGRREGESDLDYYKRMAVALKNIKDAAPLFSDWAQDIGNLLKDIAPSELKLSINKIAFQKELKNVLGKVEEVRKKWGNDPVKIKAAIDDMEISEQAREAAYIFANALYGIKIPVQRPKDDELVREARDIHWVLQNYFDKHKIKLKADASGLDPGKALQKIQGFGKSYEEWRELEKQIRESAIDTAHTLSEIGLSGTMSGKSLGLNAKFVDENTKISKKDLLTVIRLQKEAAKAKADAWGVGPFEKKNARDAAKAQRDILSERISLLRKMQEMYEKLRKLMSDTDAAQNVKESFADALDYVKMPESIVNSFVPSKEGLVKAYEQLLSTIPDTTENFKKRAELKETIAKYKLEYDEEALKTDIDEAKKKIEAAFSGLDLYTKLKGEGATDSMIDALFPGLAKSFKDVQKVMDELYGDKKGELWVKAREDAEKNLAQKTIDYNRQTVQQLMKDFKTLIDDRLELDLWYAKKRKEIEENIADEAVRTEMTANLKKQFEQKKDELTWQEFKGSDSYIRLFENLDYASTTTLKRMKERLKDMRDSLSELTPEQLKEIVAQIEKVDDVLTDRNPFATMVRGLKELAENKAKLNDLYKELETSETLESFYKDKVREQQEVVDSKEEEYKSVRDIDGAESDQAKKLRDILRLEKLRLYALKAQLEAQGKNTDAIDAAIRKLEEGLGNAKKGFAGVMSKAQQIIGGIQDLAGGLESLGIEMPEWASGTLDGLSGMASGLESFAMAQDPVSKIVAGMKVAGSLAKTIGSIFGIGNKDKKLEKRIQELQSQIEDLQHAYEKLKTAMDEAWSNAALNDASQGAVRNLRLQITKLHEMINAERAKKHSDEQKIKEYEQQIERNLETIKEIQESVAEAAGGFGAEANYKAAAQEFADAWVNAFKEGSDALEALNQTFGEFVANLIQKQVALKVAETYLRPIFKSLDDLVTEKVATDETRRIESEIAKYQQQIATAQERRSKTTTPMFQRMYDNLINEYNERVASLEKELAGSYDVIAREDLTPKDFLDWLKNGNIKDLLKDFNEDAKEWGDAWKEFADMFDLSSNAELSKLQQGIQSLSESTGTALESLLNSIRFYVAQQTTDVSAIRALLQQSSNMDVSAPSDTPMLTELRAQTAILKNIYSKLDSVIRPAGHPKQGAGIKIFMD